MTSPSTGSVSNLRGSFVYSLPSLCAQDYQNRIHKSLHSTHQTAGNSVLEIGDTTVTLKAQIAGLTVYSILLPYKRDQGMGAVVQGLPGGESHNLLVQADVYRTSAEQSLICCILKYNSANNGQNSPLLSPEVPVDEWGPVLAQVEADDAWVPREAVEAHLQRCPAHCVRNVPSLRVCEDAARCSEAVISGASVEIYPFTETWQMSAGNPDDRFIGYAPFWVGFAAHRVPPRSVLETVLTQLGKHSAKLLSHAILLDSMYCENTSMELVTVGRVLMSLAPLIKDPPPSSSSTSSTLSAGGGEGSEPGSTYRSPSESSTICTLSVAVTIQHSILAALRHLVNNYQRQVVRTTSPMLPAVSPLRIDSPKSPIVAPVALRNKPVPGGYSSTQDSVSSASSSFRKFSGDVALPIPKPPSTGAGGLIGDSSADASGWPNLSAHLQKLTGTGLLSRWKRRLFRLNRGTLSWSKEDPNEVDKTLNLSNCKLVDYPSRRYAFSIVDKEGKVVMSIACDDTEQKTAWMMEMQHTIDIVNGDTPLNDQMRKVSRDDYQLLNMIGRGSCGRVMKVREKASGQIYAIKAMSKNHLMQNNLERTAFIERGILLATKHPFIVKLHHCFQTETCLYFVMDFHCGGSLLVHLKRYVKFTEMQARVYIAEICLALDHLHSRGCMHRDLKLGNILLDKSGHAILTDFGLAIYSGQAQTFCGTVSYMAPEVLRHEPYSKAVDWWSFGIAIYQMLTGTLPFSSKDHSDICRKIMNASVSLPSNLSKGARVLILALLEKNPKERLDFRGVSQIPFFKGIDWEAVERRQLKPPFVPDTGGDDLKFFREENAKVIESRCTWEEECSVGPHFEGFTFHGT